MADVKAFAQRPLKSLDTLGSQLKFYVTAIAWTPKSVIRYKKEILRLLAEVVEDVHRLLVRLLELPQIHADAVGGREKGHVSGLPARERRRWESGRGQPCH